MRRKMTSVMLCIIMIAMAFFVTQPSVAATSVNKVKVIPVPWQEWRIVYDPDGTTVIGVDDIIFFDPPQMPEDAVAIVRWFVVLDYQIPLEDLTWEETEDLPWTLVDQEPYILKLNDEVHLFIPTEETDEAVLVRYTVAWASTPDVVESVFINEALLESKSPQVIVGSLSNFEVHNSYNETIDNFELELYGNIVPGDVLYVYDEPGDPYLAPGVFGPVWLGGWGVPPEINAIPGGIEIVWIDKEHPVQYCEWIHFGVSLRLVKKVKEVPVPVQFWQEFPGGVTDIVVFGTPDADTPGAAIVRDYVVLPYQIPLEDLTWEGTEHLPWIPIDDPANPYILQPGKSAKYDILFATADPQAVLVRYTAAWETAPFDIKAHFVNEATLEPGSYQMITGQLMNFDVHNDYDEPVDNFELELYGIQPSDIVGWYWQGMPPDPHKVGDIWYGGWGTPPHITWLPDGSGTEVLWMDPDHPVQFCEWVHFGLHIIPGVVGWGVKAYWTQLLNLTGAKAYLTQTLENETPVEKYAVLICGDYADYGQEEPGIGYSMQYGYDEFWSDMVIMYWILLENCYKDENIYFLYANGTDYPSARYDPVGTVTDYAATYDNVHMVFDGLANGTGGFPEVDDNDILVVFTFDHGGYIPGENVSTLCLIDRDMRADDFADYVGWIDAGYKMFFMQQCFSGGFIKWLEATNTVILTACDWDESGWRADDTAGTIPGPENEVIGGTTYHHGEFNYHFMNALREVSPLGYHVPSDVDVNCEISMNETFQWVNNEDSIWWETPQYSDLGGIGDNLYLRGYKYIPPASGKYAVLICGDVADYGYPEPGISYTNSYGYDEFWNDMVLMYWILLENGYTDENIFFLYGYGVDYPSDRYDPDYDPTNNITDFAATKANVELVFNTLALEMGPDDFLFVYTFDHGGLVGNISTLCLIGEDMRADEFAACVDAINCSYKLFFMQQCHSGGFIEYLDRDDYVVVTACDKYEFGWRADDLDKDGNPIVENEVLNGNTYHHGEFNYYFMNAFRKVTPLGIHVDADLNCDCRRSAYEAYRWVAGHDSMPETTQLWNLQLSKKLHLCGYHLGPTKWALLVAPVRAEWELCLKDDISDMREYLLVRCWDDDHIIFLTTESIGGSTGKTPKGEQKGETTWAESQELGKGEKEKGKEEKQLAKEEKQLAKEESLQDPNQDEWWIDGDATWQNVKNALDALEMGGTYEFVHSDGTVTEQTFEPAGEDDIIYISFKDHGGNYPDGQRPPGVPGDPRPGDEDDGYDGVFCTYGNPNDTWDPAYFWYDDEMDIELDQITCYELIFEMMACYAGEFLPDCAGNMRLVCLSCQEHESSYGVPPYYDLYDGLTQAPTNYLVDDGYVSVEEAHQWEADTIPLGIPQHPISDDQIPGETKL